MVATSSRSLPRTRANKPSEYEADFEKNPTPLYMAINNSPPEYEMDFETNPTPLYMAIKSSDFEGAIKLCSESPNDAKGWVSRYCEDASLSWRRLCIHEACIRNPSESLIAALHEAYPVGVNSQDHNERLPLHHACLHGASENVVRKLVMLFPESIDYKDFWGKTPLTIAGASTSLHRNKIIELLQKGPLYYLRLIHESKINAEIEKRTVEENKRLQAQAETEKYKLMIEETKSERDTISLEMQRKTEDHEAEIENLEKTILTLKLHKTVLKEELMEEMKRCKDLEGVLRCVAEEQNNIVEAAAMHEKYLKAVTDSHAAMMKAASEKNDIRNIANEGLLEMKEAATRQMSVSPEMKEIME